MRVVLVLLALLLGSWSTAAWAQSTPPGPPSSPSLAMVRRLGDAFAKVAEHVSPSVVQIDVTVAPNTTAGSRWFRGRGLRRGMGSGVLLSSDGEIITNNHVIEGAVNINVRLKDGRIFPATLVGRDPSTDLAVLKIPAKGLPAPRFADSSKARVGEWVIAIGSPFGLDHTVTTGVLSAKGRGGVGMNAVEDYLQTDTSINPGNSGGPLVNLAGEVLGINTMIVSRGQGIGLAVPSEMVLHVADQIRKTGRVDRAWIGVGIQDLTPQIAAELVKAPKHGALVNGVASSGPAAKANLRPGDVILSIDGRPVRDAQDVIRGVFALRVGDTTTLEVYRAGSQYQTKVKLASRGDPPPPKLPMELRPPSQAGMGLSMRDVKDPNPKNKGAIAQIISVTQGSAADRAGIRPGDLVLQADGSNRPSSEEVAKEAQDGRMLLRLRRGAATFYSALRR